MSAAEIFSGSRRGRKQAASRQRAEIRTYVSAEKKKPAFRRLLPQTAAQGGENPAAAACFFKQPAGRQIGLYRF